MEALQNLCMQVFVGLERWEIKKAMTTKKNEPLTRFEKFVEALGWLRIVASPLLLGIAAGFIVYLALPGLAGQLIAVALVLAGLTIGIYWANNVAQKHGIMNFFGRLISTGKNQEKE